MTTEVIARHVSLGVIQDTCSGQLYFNGLALIAMATKLADRASKAGQTMKLDGDGVAAILGEIITELNAQTAKAA